MNMKGHILSALREQFEQWEQLLASMGERQVTDLQTLGDWSTKDVITHLWAWQQISIARVEAALQDREPRLPAWVSDLSGDWEENANQTNAWVYDTFHGQAWVKIHQNWKEGFQRFLNLGEELPEINLLDSSKYPWLQGQPLAVILLASYDHHQEHLEKLVAWLNQHGNWSAHTASIAEE